MQTAFSSWYDEIIEDYPAHLGGSDSWAGHIPFAFYLTASLAPATLVELGVFAGNSLFAFAQAAKKKQINVALTGIDTWASDPHSGGYDGAEIYRQVCEQQANYPQSVQLKRTSFELARPEFAEKSIQMLHIDGYHHYDAVSHDYHTWREAVTDHGVILFHDTSVRRDDFGVWRFWEEMQEHHGAAKTMEFPHSNGLGILFLGPDTAYPEKIQSLRSAYADDPKAIQAYFRAQGDRVVEHFAHRQSERRWREEIERLQNTLGADLAETKARLQQIITSRSWRLTAPLRLARRNIKL